MGNPYSATNRIFVARNVLHEKTISPPNDLTVAPADLRTVALGILPFQLNPNSRIVVRRVGVFCNFADGLVFKNQHQRLDISARGIGITNSSALTATATTALNSRTLTGVGTGDDPTLADGDLLQIVKSSPARFQYLVVDGAPAAASTDVTQFPLFASAGNVTVNKLTIGGSEDRDGIIQINTLNVMHDWNWFVDPGTFNVTSISNIAILMSMNENIEIGGGGVGNLTVDEHDTVFLTKSISTDFDGDSVWMDIVTECDVTLRNI